MSNSEIPEIVINGTNNNLNVVYESNQSSIKNVLNYDVSLNLNNTNLEENNEKLMETILDTSTCKITKFLDPKKHLLRNPEKNVTEYTFNGYTRYPKFINDDVILICFGGSERTGEGIPYDFATINIKTGEIKKLFLEVKKDNLNFGFSYTIDPMGDWIYFGGGYYDLNIEVPPFNLRDPSNARYKIDAILKLPTLDILEAKDGTIFNSAKEVWISDSKLGVTAAYHSTQKNNILYYWNSINPLEVITNPRGITAAVTVALIVPILSTAVTAVPEPGLTLTLMVISFFLH